MPNVTYTNAEIQAFVNETKRLPPDFFNDLNWLERDGHFRADFDVEGEDGNQFEVKLRRNAHNAKDFSVILGVQVPNTNILFHLRRYNGVHGYHRNKIEQERFVGFHIHTATERYQQEGFDEEDFAQLTDRFDSLHQALKCMLMDCGFEMEDGSQFELFQLL